MTSPQSYQRFYQRVGLSVLFATSLFACSESSPSLSLPSLSDLSTQEATAQPIQQPSNKATNRANWSAIEQDMVAEHNRIRQNPQSYIPILEDYLASMNADGNIPNGCGRNCTLLTQEGKPAVEEAIRFLRNQQPVGGLSVSSAVAQAAKSHAQDQRDGATGHSSSDGSSFADRLNRFGVQNVAMAENISYGPATAQDVVMALIVDDGVASRGHRTNIFAPDWAIAGVGCGDHAVYGTVCVINYTSR